MTSESAMEMSPRSPETAARTPASARTESRAANPDAPVRIEVKMPRHLFDRLADHEHAPRCRYDMATGIAEYVAEPGVLHEGQIWEIARLFDQIEYALHDAGHPRKLCVAGATRLLSDDGAFEPDQSLFTDSADALAATQVEDYLDVRKGHPAPDLVVEIDRSVDSSHKLGPYFRMGVREAWTWSRRDGVRIWGPDPDAPLGFRSVEGSRVLVGLTREDLALLLSGTPSLEASRRIARRVAEALASPSGAAPQNEVISRAKPRHRGSR